VLESVKPHEDILGGFVDGGLVDVEVGSTCPTFMFHCSGFGVTLKDRFQVEGKLIVSVRGYQ
jgi:hypothetical protein